MIFVFGQTDAFSEGGEGMLSGVSALRQAAPHAHIIGASTGSSIAGQALHEEGLQALAIGFERVSLRQAAVTVDAAQESYDAGVRLGKALLANDLRHVLMLSKGLEINGSQLAEGMTSVIGDRVSLSGGMAGDGARFGQTFVLLDGQPQEHMVAAIGFYGDALRIGTSASGGWREFGPERLITRSEGSTLIELDGVPALDLYERYLGDEAAGLPASALIYPLKIRNPDYPDREMVRTVLSVDKETRTLTFAGDMPEGWSARLMRGQFDNLVLGAEAAAEEALKSLRRLEPDLRPELSLMVSCVGRRLLMGQRTVDEVEAVSAILGDDVPQTGFYSYGEIAPLAGTGVSGLHNQTVCLTLFAEVP
nr:FIST N-terminal domain-containing protein [Asticcacaulis aquaticus]